MALERELAVGCDFSGSKIPGWIILESSEDFMVVGLQMIEI